MLKKIVKGNPQIKVADGDTLGILMKQLSVENEEYKQEKVRILLSVKRNGKEIILLSAEQTRKK